MLSFGTAGCNLSCRFCQNRDISFSSREQAIVAAIESERALRIGAAPRARPADEPLAEAVVERLSYLSFPRCRRPTRLAEECDDEQDGEHDADPDTCPGSATDDPGGAAGVASRLRADSAQVGGRVPEAVARFHGTEGA